MSDSEFLRDVAHRILRTPSVDLFNTEDARRLQRIALDLERPRTDVIFREANAAEARNMRSYVAGFPVPADDVLDLTPEMEIPPGVHTDLDVFMQTYNRDLVAEVRGELRNAMENEHDMLKNFSDDYIAEDLQGCTDGYDGIDTDLLAKAVAAVRADPTGVYPC